MVCVCVGWFMPGAIAAPVSPSPVLDDSSATKKSESGIMTRVTVLAFEPVGCYRDDSDSPGTLLSATFPSTSEEDCLEVCDISGVSACAYRPGSCLGGTFDNSNWDRNGRVGQGAQCESFEDSEAYTIFQIGRGSTLDFYSGSGPLNQVSPEVGRLASSVRVQHVGCAPTSEFSLLASDLSIPDCFAECTQREAALCAIDFGGRHCYFAPEERSVATVAQEQCDAPCRYPELDFPNVLCGGMRKEGSRVSLYKLGPDGFLLNELPDTGFGIDVSSIPRIDAGAGRREQMVANDVPASEGFTESSFFIISIALGAVVLLGIMTMFAVIIKRKKSRNTDRVPQRQPQTTSDVEKA